MRKLNFLIIALLLIARSAFAMDTPINAGGVTLPSTTATNYSPMSGNRLTWSATETGVRSIIPLGGTGKKFYANVATAPGVGKSWAFEFMKNGVASGVTCTIADTATDCNDTSNTVSVSAGDSLTIRSIPTGTPASPVQIRFAWTFSAGTQESIIIGGLRSTTLSTTGTEYTGLQGLSLNTATIGNADQPFPTAGTLSNLWVETNGTAGIGASYVFTITKNGSDQSLTCTVSGAVSAVCSDTSNSFSVTAGDLVTIKSVPSAVPAPTARLVRWGVKWAPTIDGESVFMTSNGSAMNTAGAARYTSVYGTNQTWQSTEANMTDLVGDPFELRKMYVVFSPAPGGTDSYAIKTRVNGANGNLSVSISGANTTGSDTTHTDSVTAANLIALSSLSSGSPVSAIAKIGVVSYIAPPATPTPTPTSTPTVTPTPTATPTATPTPTPASAIHLLCSTGVGQ